MRKFLPVFFYVMLLLPLIGYSQPTCPASDWLPSNSGWLIDRSNAFDINFEAKYILDGTTSCSGINCRWVSPDGSPSGYAIFDFGKLISVDGFRIYSNEQDNEQPKNLKLHYASSASGPWTELSSYTAQACVSCPATGHGWEEFPSFTATSARFWKLEIVDSYSNRFQINEVQFKGCETPVVTYCPDASWLTSNPQWVVSRSSAFDANFDAAFILDGTTSCSGIDCRWVSDDQPSGFAVFDFGANVILGGFRIYSNEQDSEQPKHVNFQAGSSATGPWATVSSYIAKECVSCSSTGNGWEEFPSFDAQESRYWRLEIVDSYGSRFQINEVQFKGCSSVLTAMHSAASREKNYAFPNPTDGKVSFKEEIKLLKIYNAQGTMVREYSNVSEVTLNLPKGIYVFVGDRFTERVEVF